MNMERVEPVTGIGPALPAWKAGALPLSYAGGWCREQIPPTPCGLPVFPGRQIQKEEDHAAGVWTSPRCGTGRT